MMITVKETIEITSDCWEEWTLPQFQERLQETLDRVPEEYRSSAKVKLQADMCWDQETARLLMTYERPENQEERLQREAKEAWMKRDTEEQERRLLAKLSKKYGA